MAAKRKKPSLLVAERLYKEAECTRKAEYSQKSFFLAVTMTVVMVDDVLAAGCDNLFTECGITNTANRSRSYEPAAWTCEP